MKTEDEIKASLAAARDREEHLKHMYDHYRNAYVQTSHTSWCLELELKAYPRKLYWSKVTPRPWPMEILRLITEYGGIAEKLYLHGRPSDRKLLQPRTLAALHIKHLLQSAAVFRYVGELRYWLKLNSITVSHERPKWKRYVSKPSLKEMATLFRSPRFVVGGMVLTLLGENGIIEVQVGPECEDMLFRVKWLSNLSNAPLSILGDRIIVAYKPLRSDVHVCFGGRGRMKRLVKAYKAQ